MACLDRIIDLLKPLFLLKAGMAHQKVSKLRVFCVKGFPLSPKTLNIHEAQGFHRAQAS